MLLYINDRQICCVYHSVVMLFVLCCSVAESPTKKGNETIDQEIPNQAETVPNVTSSRFQRVSIVVTVLVLLIVIIVCFIIFDLRKKRTQAHLFSSATIEEQTTTT